MAKNKKKDFEGFPILNFTEIDLTSVKEEKFEDSELNYIDANQFGNCKDIDKFIMVMNASSSLPPNAYLTNATSQIHYLADQVNRVIHLKILYNNLLDKLRDQVNKNNELMNMLDKTDPNKLKDLEVQMEKLRTENEIKKTNSEKRKQPIQKKDKLGDGFAFIHESHFTAIYPIDQFEYVNSSSEEWKIMNTDKQDPNSKYQKSKLSIQGNYMKNAFHQAIENYFVKAIFDEYNICIKIRPTSFYKSTTEPYIYFKCTCVICFHLSGKTEEPKSTIKVIYYKNATGYFKLESSEEFPCVHRLPFPKDPKKEPKSLNRYDIEERKYQDEFKKFQEKYNSVKNNKKIPIINAEVMDAEEICRFMKSQVKEKTFSKDVKLKNEKRDIEKPCTSSAVSKQMMNIDNLPIYTNTNSIYQSCNALLRNCWLHLPCQ